MPSELKVNKLSPYTGSTLTIGDSGDTISLPSGVSLDTLTITGDLTVDTDTLFVDSTNNRVGVGTTSPSVTFDAEADGATVAHFNRATSDGDIIELQKDGTTIGSIGYTSIGFYIDGESAHSGIRFGASQYVPKVNGSDSDNGVSLGTAVARFKDLYLGGDIYLGGTTSSNALDDYEEGTWTPTENNGVTLTDNETPRYTKIGDMVHCWFDVTVATNTNGNGFDISNAPFTARDIGCAGGVVYFCDMNNATSDAGLSFQFHPTVNTRAQLKSGYDANVTLTTMSGHRIAGCLIYKTDA